MPVSRWSAGFRGAAPASAAENVTGDLGISYNTHFISYGFDVWGGGTDFYGDRSTTFIYGDLFIKVTDSLTISFGAWADINRNVPSAIGGSIQEIDVYPGITYTVGRFTLGATYQAWSYAGDVEESIDLSVALQRHGSDLGRFRLQSETGLAQSRVRQRRADRRFCVRREHRAELWIGRRS